MIDVNNGNEDMDDESVREIVNESTTATLFDKLSWDVGAMSEAELLKRAHYTTPLTNPLDYLRNKLNQDTVFRYIQTHPDLDHMRGLAKLSENFTILNFWDHPNTKKWGNHQHQRNDKRDWDAYRKLGEGDQPVVIHTVRGSVGAFYNKAGDKCHGISILSPTDVFRKGCDDTEDWNNMSYVLKYCVDDKTIIFGGDAEDKAWENIVAAYTPEELKCDILKASHHGRDSGYYQEAVKMMAPEVTIVSVGKKPETDASNKYRHYSGKVMSTRHHGNIRAVIKDGTINWEFDE